MNTKFVTCVKIAFAVMVAVIAIVIPGMYDNYIRESYTTVPTLEVSELN